MEVKTKTIYIPKKLIQSLPIGMMVSIFFVFVVHLFGSWEVLEYKEPPNSWDMNLASEREMWLASPKYYGYENFCLFWVQNHKEKFGKAYHYLGDFEGTFNKFRLTRTLTNTFQEHWLALTFFSFIFSFLIYILSFFKLKFKIT